METCSVSDLVKDSYPYAVLEINKTDGISSTNLALVRLVGVGGRHRVPQTINRCKVTD